MDKNLGTGLCYDLYHDTWAFPLMWSGVLIAKLPHYVFMGCITFFPRCITNSVIHLVSIILSLMSRNEISRCMIDRTGWLEFHWKGTIEFKRIDVELNPSLKPATKRISH